MATSILDRLIIGADSALRTIAGEGRSERPNPAREISEADAMTEAERRHAAGLMRVNHTGEICAQALYQGQALVARNAAARRLLEEAAEEEADHLAWCAERLEELSDRPSVLNPIFYGASLGMGVLTGLAGDRVSLGFVHATEDRVVEHLDAHLEEAGRSLPEQDGRSRAILEQMRDDEARHGETAIEAGGAEFPEPVKRAMALLSKVMTETTYRV